MALIINGGNWFLVIAGCGKRTERDKGSFCRIPKIREHSGPEKRAGCEKRRRVLLKAIARDDNISKAKLNDLLETFREWYIGLM